MRTVRTSCTTDTVPCDDVVLFGPVQFALTLLVVAAVVVACVAVVVLLRRRRSRPR